MRSAIALAFVALLLALGCESHSESARSGEALVAALGRSTPASRTIEGRTSVPTRYARCSPRATLLAAVRCAPPSLADAPTLAAAARAAARARASADPEALRAAALADLHWGDGGKSLTRSIQFLAEAARRERTSAAWADLAAAELAHADAGGGPNARLRALDAAARAVSADSMNGIARFNLALAAEALGLDGRAHEEWMRYRTMETDTAWRGEAGERLTAIERRAVPRADGPLSPARLDTLAARDPGALRLRLFTEEVGAWGRARRDGARRDADSALGTLHMAGAALARAAGDASIADIAGELTGASASVAVAAAEFAEGQRAAGGGRYAVAESLFARAATVKGASALAAWARTYEAVQRIQLGDPGRGRAELARAMALTPARRDPALQARAGWTLGVVLARAGKRAEAGRVMRRVETLATALGDSESVGAVRELRAEDLYLGGDERGTWREELAALSALRAHPASLRLHGALNLLAVMADDRGLGGAAAVIRREDAGVALASGHRDFHVEALLAAARSQALQGDSAGALATLRELEKAAAALPPSDVRQWLVARMTQVRVDAGAPVRASDLDSAVVLFRRQDNSVLLANAYATRARVAARRDPSLAVADLDSALALLRGRGVLRGTLAERRALERRIHDVSAHLALAMLARGDTLSALRTVERGRGGDGDARPKGLLVLDYLLLADTLVTWRIERGLVAATRATVRGDDVPAARDRLLHGAEQGALDARALEELYDLLLRPQENALRRAEQLAIVGDEEIAGLPFAALRGRGTDAAYIVDRMSVQVRSRLGEVTPERDPAVRRALFVADPAFDRSRDPELAPLPGARREVAESRVRYASSQVLEGRAATATAVRAAMPGAELVHFASHARFDAERPEESRLVLAPDASARDGLTAREISGMALGGVRLVVLSTCESTRSGAADAPVTVGLARAFHDAGVPGVVGALWKVDDDATALLMAEFHRRYSVTRDVARALRDAQRVLRNDPRPAFREPAAWGAFVFSSQ